jgi:hypothetical protein
VASMASWLAPRRSVTWLRAIFGAAGDIDPQ